MKDTMASAKIKFIVFFMLLNWMVFPAFASGESASLPWNLLGGTPAQESGFIDENVYEDPTIRVQLEEYWVKETRCLVARVWIADPSQLRTAPAYDFARDQEAYVVDMARRVNAIVAINGDYYSYWRETQGGYLIRQGTMYLDQVIARRDVLLIDDQGDFTIVQDSSKEKIAEAVNGKRIVNSFNFGPGLIVDGVRLDKNYDALYNRSAERHQRCAICQLEKGSGEYLMAVCEGVWTEEERGLTMLEWADFLASLGGVTNAYNLDGGNSTALIFHGAKQNETSNPHHRKLSDIIYFASAYKAEEE